MDFINENMEQAQKVSLSFRFIKHFFSNRMIMYLIILELKRRINNKYYDLTPFLDKHPGGRQILEMCRDRFEDSTYPFEAHHLD